MGDIKLKMSKEDLQVLNNSLDTALEISGKYRNNILKKSSIVNKEDMPTVELHTALLELRSYLMKGDDGINPNGDIVLQFIRNFYDNVPYFYREGVRSEFRAGYCYYFAHMLEDAFPGGVIVLCAPYSHIAYQYNGKVYDVEGLYEGEADFFIPISYLGDFVRDFMHIPGEFDYGATKSDTYKIIDKYRIDNRQRYIDMIGPYRGTSAEELFKGLSRRDLIECYEGLVEVIHKYKDIREIAVELYVSLMSGQFEFKPYQD